MGAGALQHVVPLGTLRTPVMLTLSRSLTAKTSSAKVATSRVCTLNVVVCSSVKRSRVYPLHLVTFHVG